MAEAAATYQDFNPCALNVAVDGIQIYYERMGKGPEVLLLLPGSLGTSSTFRHQLNGLNHELFTIIAWNAPGYGFSRPPDRNFTKYFYHQDAIWATHFMRALNFKKFSLLGWDEGGTTAMIMASNYPDMVQRLIVFGAFAKITSEIMACIQQESERGNAGTSKPQAPQEPQVPKRTPKMHTFYDQTYFISMQEKRLKALQDILKDGGEICMKLLGNIKCPTLILHGMQDRFVSFTHVLEIQRSIPGARLETFPTGYHKLHIKDRIQFNFSVEKFVRGTMMDHS